MIEIHVTLKRKKSQKVDYVVWPLGSQLKGIFHWVTTTSWMNIFILFHCIDWLLSKYNLLQL